MVHEDRIINERCHVCETELLSRRKKAEHLLQYHVDLGQTPIKLDGVKEEIIVDQFGPRLSIKLIYSDNDKKIDWFNVSLGMTFLKYSKVAHDIFRLNYPINGQVFFHLYFTILNYQDITNYRGEKTKEVRQTNSSTVVKGSSFNQTVFNKLKAAISRKIYTHGESGSSWRFFRFNKIGMDVHDANTNILGFVGGDSPLCDNFIASDNGSDDDGVDILEDEIVNHSSFIDDEAFDEDVSFHHSINNNIFEEVELDSEEEAQIDDVNMPQINEMLLRAGHKELKENDVLPVSRAKVDDDIITCVSDSKLKTYQKQIEGTLFKLENADEQHLCLFNAIAVAIYSIIENQNNPVNLTFDQTKNKFPLNIANVLEKIKPICQGVRYIQIYNKLLYINEILLEENFCINFYCLRDEIKQVIFKDTDDSHVKTRQDKRLVTLVDTVFNGLSEIEGVKPNTNELRFIDLLASLTTLTTFTVSYCNDIAVVFKVTYEKKGQNLQMGRGYICYHCSRIFLNKKNFEKHRVVCTGIHGVSFEVKERKCLTYEKYFNKKLSLPYEIFYDLETTSGNDLDNLKTISYCIMVYFNPDLSLKPIIIIYREINHSLEQLTFYDLPSYLGEISPNRKRLVSEVSAKVLLQKKNSMEHRCCIDILILYELLDNRWLNEKLLIRNFCYNAKKAKQFVKEHGEQRKECWICHFPISNKEEDVLANQDLISSFHAEKFYQCYYDVLKHLYPIFNNFMGTFKNILRLYNPL